MHTDSNKNSGNKRKIEDLDDHALEELLFDEEFEKTEGTGDEGEKIGTGFRKFIKSSIKENKKKQEEEKNDVRKYFQKQRGKTDHLMNGRGDPKSVKIELPSHLFISSNQNRAGHLSDELEQVEDDDEGDVFLEHKQHVQNIKLASKISSYFENTTNKDKKEKKDKKKKEETTAPKKQSKKSKLEENNDSSENSTKKNKKMKTKQNSDIDNQTTKPLDDFIKSSNISDKNEKKLVISSSNDHFEDSFELEYIEPVSHVDLTNDKNNIDDDNDYQIKIESQLKKINDLKVIVDSLELQLKNACKNLKVESSILDDLLNSRLNK